MGTLLDLASLVVVPSGYKEDVVYSVKPTDGSGDLDFTRSNDTATRVNSAGLIEKVITNVFTHSEDFTNAVWEKTNAAITANTTIAPNGTLTADSLLSNTISNVDHMVRFTTSMAVSTEHTASFYAKQIVTRFAYIRDLTNNEASVFDLQDGVVSFQAASHTAHIVADGSFYRVSITFQTPAVIINNLIDLGCTTSSTGITSVMPIGEGIAIWGAMLQTGVLTPYIPTTTTAVSVGMLANVPRLDYTGGGCPKLLLEPQRTNLVTFSEQFNNAAWSKTNTTITANTAISPDGFQNADRAQLAAGALLFQSGLGSAGSNTLSVYAKATNGVSAKFRFFANGATLFSSDQTATGDWQRFTFTFTFSAVTSGISVATTGADDVLFYGFQHEIGAYATSYIPTLGAAVTRGADACSKTGISSLIGQTQGTIFAQFKGVISGGSGASRLSISNGTTSNWIFVGTESNSLRGFINASGSNIISDTSVFTTGNDKIAIAYKSGNVALYINGVQIATSTTAFTFSGTLSEVTSGVAGTFSVDETLGLDQLVVFPTRLTNTQLAELTTP